MKANRAVVKLGTNSITNEDGRLNEELISSIVEQVVSVSDQWNVLLVTSGAVAAGLTLIDEKRYDETTNRQIYASVGQVQLMKMYASKFAEHNQVVAQMLTTKDDFTNRDHYLNMKNCLESLFKENIIPIMNENDFVAIEELMFTDNDELAGLVSQMLNADKLIVLTNVEGVLDENGVIVREFNYDDPVPNHILSAKSKSSFGKGGIQTKFKMAQEVAENGSEVYICNSIFKDVISRILAGEHIGTKFNPR